MTTEMYIFSAGNIYSLSSAEIKKLDNGLYQIHARRWIKSAKKFTRQWSEYIIPCYENIAEKDVESLGRK